MIEAAIIDEDEKFKVIEKEIVMMASKGIAHEPIKSALLIAVARALPDDLTMGVEVTLRLADTTMIEPDIAVFPKALFRKSSTGFAQPIPARLISSSRLPPQASPTIRASRHGFAHATASESFGSSAPTSASHGFTPVRTTRAGHRSSNAGRSTRLPPERCLASRSDSARPTEEDSRSIRRLHARRFPLI